MRVLLRKRRLLGVQNKRARDVIGLLKQLRRWVLFNCLNPEPRFDCWG